MEGNIIMDVHVHGLVLVRIRTGGELWSPRK